MFWIGLSIGIVFGANIALVLYALILAGKHADENMSGNLSSDF